MSHARSLDCGVPQGSSLSPLMFKVYLQPLITALANMDCYIFNYADDTQLVVKLDNSVQACENVQGILRFIMNWMTSNWLKTNPDKTEVLAISTKGCPWSDRFWPTELGTAPAPVKVVKSLGIKVDADLSMKQQVVLVCGSCIGILRQLRKLVPLLMPSTLRTMVTAQILNRLDYGNVLYIGLPTFLLDKLQIVMNDAARLLFGLPRRAHAKPLLKELHWLPIKQRAESKGLCMAIRPCVEQHQSM